MAIIQSEIDWISGHPKDWIGGHPNMLINTQLQLIESSTSKCKYKYKPTSVMNLDHALNRRPDSQSSSGTGDVFLWICGMLTLNNAHITPEIEFQAGLGMWTVIVHWCAQWPWVAGQHDFNVTTTIWWIISWIIISLLSICFVQVTVTCDPACILEHPHGAGAGPASLANSSNVFW